MLLKNKLLKRSFIGMSIFFVLFLQGCMHTEKADTKADDKVIGVVTKSADSEYWLSVCSGMEDAAGKYGAKILILSPDSEVNDKMQEKIIRDFIQKQVDALAISPLQSFNADYIREASEKGILIISYDTRIEEENIPYIGIDNYKAGQDIAKEMIKQIGTKGQVGIIAGDLNQSSHEERYEGFCQYLQDNSEITVGFVESGYSNRLMTKSHLNELLNECENLRGIFATSAVTALGIADYLKDGDIKIMTVDAQQDAIESVKSGKIAALCAQSGYDIGYETIKSIVEYQNTGVLVTDKILEANILTRDTVEQWTD